MIAVVPSDHTSVMFPYSSQVAAGPISVMTTGATKAEACAPMSPPARAPAMNKATSSIPTRYRAKPQASM